MRDVGNPNGARGPGKGRWRGSLIIARRRAFRHFQINVIAINSYDLAKIIRYNAAFRRVAGKTWACRRVWSVCVCINLRIIYRMVQVMFRKIFWVWISMRHWMYWTNRIFWFEQKKSKHNFVVEVFKNAVCQFYTMVRIIRAINIFHYRD